MLGRQRRAGLSERCIALDCNAQALRRAAPAPMLRRMTRTLSTADVAARHRLAFWTDVVCDTYVQLDCEPPAGADAVEGEIVADSLATLQLSRVTATAQQVRRTPAKIARASEDYFLVSIQTQGRGVISQDGRDAVLGPGDFALYDSTRPY